LFAAGNRADAFEDFDVVVEFFVDGGPVLKAFGEAGRIVGEGNFDGQLGAVGAGLEAEVFEPKGVGCAGSGAFVGVADAVGMHGAMEVYSGNAVAMRGEDGFDIGLFVDVGTAFVVDDEVVAFGVIRIAEDGERWLGGFVVGMDLIDDDVDSRFEAFFQDVFLFSIFVAATASDEEGFERFLVGGERINRESKGKKRAGDDRMKWLHAFENRGKRRRTPAASIQKN
jgi:hypothetical protein